MAIVQIFIEKDQTAKKLPARVGTDIRQYLLLKAWLRAPTWIVDPSTSQPHPGYKQASRVTRVDVRCDTGTCSVVFLH